jgi:FAD/FMN-containing dehydrogenase
VEALRYARAAKLPVRVRAGGHQHEDFHVIGVEGDFDDPNFDLYWAVSGGGGGNFGVATEYVFGTVPFTMAAGESAAVARMRARWCALQS